MASAQDYRTQISELGLDTLDIAVSNLSEGKESLARIRGLQQALRQIKRNINLEIKDINATYREKSANASAGTATVFSLFGKRKFAGQLRADEKRRLARERSNIVGAYDGVKLTIDDLLIQLDGAKIQLQNYIEEAKAADRTEKQSTSRQQTDVSDANLSKYCAQCGSDVGQADKFCRVCGHRQ